jgi:hypothetical protein
MGEGETEPGVVDGCGDANDRGRSCDQTRTARISGQGVV